MPLSKPTGRRAIAVKCSLGLVTSLVPDRTRQSARSPDRFSLPDRSARAKVGSVFPRGGRPFIYSFGENLWQQYTN